MSTAGRKKFQPEFFATSNFFGGLYSLKYTKKDAALLKIQTSADFKNRGKFKLKKKFFACFMIIKV